MTAEVRRLPRRSLPAVRENPNWWVQPLAVAIGFTLFVVYSFWSVAFGAHKYAIDPYLSPYYSPTLKFGWWPLSSAFLVAWVPLGFRATCYYYRKAYYRSFFLDPPACTRGEPSLRSNYVGETRFPLILNNFHRFFLYLSLIVLAFLWWDTISAFHTLRGLYLGVGSILMLLNVVFISMYTFSCHALRHLVGGSVDCFSCVRAGKARHGLWGLVSRINPYHGTFAWFSLVSVASVDIYIRLVASSVFGHCIGPHTGC